MLCRLWWPRARPPHALLSIVVARYAVTTYMLCTQHVCCVQSIHAGYTTYMMCTQHICCVPSMDALYTAHMLCTQHICCAHSIYAVSIVVAARAATTRIVVDCGGRALRCVHSIYAVYAAYVLCTEHLCWVHMPCTQHTCCARSIYAVHTA